MERNSELGSNRRRHSTSDILLFSVEPPGLDKYLDPNSSDPLLASPQSPAPKISHSPEPSPPPHDRRRDLRFWILEFLAFLLAIGLIAAITVLLARYHDKPTPDWPYNINISTVVAILSTLLASSVVMIATEALGQLRWLWFASPRPLYDLHRFDQGFGMRGSFALVALLVKAKTVGRQVGILVLIATAMVVGIGSLAIGPFSQQAIRTEVCQPETASNALVLPVAHYVPWPNGRPQSGDYNVEVDSDVRAAMINGFIPNPRGNTQDDLLFGITPVCATGNCTFEDYGTGITHSSMGLCSSCIDMTDMISVNTSAANITGRPSVVQNLTIPMGDKAYWITPESQNMAFWVNSRPPQAVNDRWEAHLRNTITLANLGVMMLSDSPCQPLGETQPGAARSCPRNITAKTNPTATVVTDAVAVMCRIYPCVRSYKAEVHMGVFDEQIVSVAQVNTSNGLSSVLFRDPCWLSRDEVYTSANISQIPRTPGRTFINISYASPDKPAIEAPSECVYRLDDEHLEWLRAFINTWLKPADPQRQLSGVVQCRTSRGDPEIATCPDNAWWLAPLFQRRNATLESISHAMNRFVVATSNQFRVVKHWPEVPWTETIVSNNITGKFVHTETRLFLDWEWLLLPYALVTLTGLLLAGVVATNYLGTGDNTPIRPVWKASILPLLLYGMRDSNQPLEDRQPRQRQTVDNGRETKEIIRDDILVDLDEVEKVAKRTVVMFECRSDYPGFVKTEN